MKPKNTWIGCQQSLQSYIALEVRFHFCWCHVLWWPWNALCMSYCPQELPDVDSSHRSHQTQSHFWSLAWGLFWQLLFPAHSRYLWCDCLWSSYSPHLADTSPGFKTIEVDNSCLHSYFQWCLQWLVKFSLVMCNQLSDVKRYPTGRWLNQTNACRVHSNILYFSQKTSTIVYIL